MRCPFCDSLSGYVYGNIELKEPIKNYYNIRIDDYPKNTFNTVEPHIINGLTYFPCEECFEQNMDVGARRKKAMEGLKREA